MGRHFFFSWGAPALIASDPDILATLLPAARHKVKHSSRIYHTPTPHHASPVRGWHPLNSDPDTKQLELGSIDNRLGRPKRYNLGYSHIG